MVHGRRRRPGAHPRSRGENSASCESSIPTRWLIPAHAGKTIGHRRRRRHRRAHPRSRGENCACSRRFDAWVGSSPLTRGKRLKLVWRHDEPRLIPAHAGKTRGASMIRGLGPAHPRSRGENRAAAALVSAARGSSPLTRGKLHAELLGEIDDGLIPAHAGKTPARPRRSQSEWAHPRSRGENSHRLVSAVASSGSSPLTRGKRQSPSQTLPYLGLIPAHAGKTEPERRGLIVEEAHPRSRGENASERRRSPVYRGSSPLTRGKQTCAMHRARCIGLIPAHAGKTDWTTAMQAAGRAHPRSRGENGVGLPLALEALRLIPAHAGKTPVGNTRQIAPTAHPRSRGENTS